MHELIFLIFFFWCVRTAYRRVTGSEGQRRCTKSVENARVSPSCTLSHWACINISLDLALLLLSVPASPTLCSNFSTTTAPKPPCLHNEFSQSDYSCTILLSVIIRQELELKTFVSYYFNSATSPWRPSHSSVLMNLST